MTPAKPTRQQIAAATFGARGDVRRGGEAVSYWEGVGTLNRSCDSRSTDHSCAQASQTSRTTMMSGRFGTVDTFRASPRSFPHAGHLGFRVIGCLTEELHDNSAVRERLLGETPRGASTLRDLSTMDRRACRNKYACSRLEFW